jgi:hypothetical protein
MNSIAYSDDLALTDFFGTEEFLKGHAVELCQSDNTLTSGQTAGTFPTPERCPGNTRYFGDFHLRQSFLMPQIMQPRSVRVSPCFCLSPHAPARVNLKIPASRLLVINDQLYFPVDALTRLVLKTSLYEKSIHGRMLILASRRGSRGTTDEHQEISSFAVG